MSQLKQFNDVLWSPYDEDKFVVVGTDLNLYTIEQSSDPQVKPLSIPLSDTSSALLLSTNTEIQYIKCASWYPMPAPENLLAVGQANGKVTLVSLGQSNDSNWVGKEFVPKHGRQCNCLSWSPGQTNMLAEGLDKHRSDCSVLIWDIQRGANSISSVTDSERRQSATLGSDSVSSTRPIYEFGVAEVTHSLQWFPKQPSTLVVGMNNKHLKVFDLKDPKQQVHVTSSRAVLGVCVDPHFEHRLASWGEGHVLLWDLRNFEKPVLTLNTPRQILKLSWSPTRSKLLSCITRESSYLSLYDIQPLLGGSDEVEPAVISRKIQPCNQENLLSFAWHPTLENRVLFATSTGRLSDYMITDHMCLSWSPSSQLIWSYGRQLLQYVDQKELSELSDDGGLQMRLRAMHGYGLKSPALWQNGVVPGCNDQLKKLWEWLDMVQVLKEENKSPSLLLCQNETFPGICSILNNSNQQGAMQRNDVLQMSGALQRSDSSLQWSTGMRSEPVMLPWIGIDRGPGTIGLRAYQSDERDCAQQLCGWGGRDREGIKLSLLLDRLENEGKFQRAAAIAVFNMRIRRAIQTLLKGAMSNVVDLNVVAMALSGYTEDRHALWREMCNSLRLQLTNPYLRAVFAFLTSDGDGYEEVLHEDGMELQDRVAFACIFLPDIKLYDFVNRHTQLMVDTGNLEGILLTGLSKDGMELLQKYVDFTGDVQTAGIVGMLGMINVAETARDVRARYWADSYKELLDQWRMWHQRAEFDIHWSKMDSLLKANQQVFISCHFCGISISSHIIAVGRDHPSLARLGAGGGNKSKITCCPGCRKPLPRCAICLINMGTCAGIRTRRTSGVTPSKQEDTLTNKANPFGMWFSWCQTCRHGGHASHLIEWFQLHTDCPVTGCTCHCMSLDAVGKVEIT